MNDYKLYESSETTYHDYINYCIDKLGLKFKWESLRIFNYCNGVRMYQTKPTGEVVEVFYRPSVSFLRYSVAHTYLDGVYLGKFPHRSTEDLISKMALSLSATKNPRTHMCHLASLARLSSGNLEAYDQLFKAYFELVDRFSEPTRDEWDRFYMDAKNLPFSVRMVIQSTGRIYSFPSIFDLHDQQTKGFKNRTGFAALDVDGMQVDGAAYYKKSAEIRGIYDTTVAGYLDDYETMLVAEPFTLTT